MGVPRRGYHAGDRQPADRVGGLIVIVASTERQHAAHGDALGRQPACRLGGTAQETVDDCTLALVCALVAELAPCASSVAA